MKKLRLALALLAMASAAGANSFTADGTVFETAHGYSHKADRSLVNDGSFEDGTCYTGNSAWTCVSDNDCDWIVDLAALGLWNYDGNHSAWLGGFCHGAVTIFTSICQTMLLDTSCQPGLSWYWLAYVEGSGSRIYLTISGDTVWEKVLQLSDHLLDYQYESATLLGYEGEVHEVCFHYEHLAYGSNYFLDFVEFTGLDPTALESGSLSTVKSMY